MREKSKSDLQNQLKELKAELALLRVAKVTGGAPNKLSKMYVLSTNFRFRFYLEHFSILECIGFLIVYSFAKLDNGIL